MQPVPVESVAFTLSSKEPLLGNFLEAIGPAAISGSDFESTR
jgi:hypothetical protein